MEKSKEPENTVQGLEFKLSNTHSYYLPFALFDSSFSFFAWNLVIHESIPGNEIEFLCEYLSEGDYVINIGAEFSIYSITLSEIVGRSGQIVIIEDNTSLTDIIFTNIRHYSINNITVTPSTDTSCITEHLLQTCTLIRISASYLIEQGLSLLGQRFQEHSNSPLLQLYFSDQMELTDRVFKHLNDLGYSPYQYCHCLKSLVPFMPESFPVRDIIFFCESRKAEHLNKTGMLAFKQTSGNNTPLLPNFRNLLLLETLPYIKSLKHFLTDKPEGHDDYINALCCYTDAFNPNHLDVSVNYDSLRQAYRIMSSFNKDQLNISRSLTFARITLDLGFVGLTIQLLDEIYVTLTSEQDLSLNEYFLLPSKVFENIIEPNDIGNWLLSSVVNAIIENKYSNLKDADETTLSLLNILDECGYLLPKMERYKQILEVKYGYRKSLCPSPSLTFQQEDNLNSIFWKNLE